MSVVSRQGFKYSIIGYFGFLIGTLSSIYVYPYDMEFYGTLRYVLATAELLFPFVLIGISHANVRFFKELEKTNQQQNLVSFSFVFTFLSSIVLFSIVEISFLSFPKIQNLLFFKYRFYIYVLVYVLAVTQIISRYLTNKKRIAIPGLLENLVPEFGTLVAFTLFVFFSASRQISLWMYVFFFVFSLLVMYFYLKKLDSFQFTKDFTFLKTDSFYKKLFSYGAFSLLGSVGSYVALRINVTMIGEFLDEKSNGIYAIYLSLITILSIPTLGVYNIASPIIRNYLTEKNTKELNEFYQKTSFVLFYIGSIFFVMLCSGIEDLFYLMKNGNELIAFLPIVYILGFATLFDLATGFNSHIISMSDKYKFNVYFMLFLAVLNILLNYLFMTKLQLGIIGVAYSTLISLSLYNLVKLIYNWKIFQVQPFSISLFKVFLLVACALFILYLIPKTENHVVNLFVFPFLVLFYFVLGNLILNIIPIKNLFSTNWKNFITGK